MTPPLRIVTFGALFSLMACNQSSSKQAPALLPVTPERLEAKCADCKEVCAPPAADACYQLGVRFELGKEVDKDPARARDLFARAAAAGHPGAKARMRDKDKEKGFGM